MEILAKVKLDHIKKSNQVKKLKRKLKNKAKEKTTIPKSKLQQLLGRERAEKIDSRDYYSWGEFDDSGYTRDSAKQEARIEILEELLKEQVKQ